jgi:hypothetical protein
MTISARFVSRNASFPTKCVMPQRPDLGSLTPNTELATGTEKMPRRMRRYKTCRFSCSVTSPACADLGYRGVSHGDRGPVCLTDRFISYGSHDELPRIPPTRVLVQ